MPTYTSDVEIARHAHLLPIEDVAGSLGIPASALVCYGTKKAKVDPRLVYKEQQKERQVDASGARHSAKLVLVTALNPTPAGEGKTTVSIGLADALSARGHRTSLALREPSLGPVFGIKGGACGGGYAQIAPMEDINLHFTGDFHAIESANNLLSAVIDNHIHQGNALDLDPRRIVWRRCLDVNDRQLRHIVTGLGGSTSGVPHEDGFDICAASEIMAVLCLARDLEDLRVRLGRMIVGYTYDKRAVRAEELGCVGALLALLRDAFMPNLVQTLEHTPAFVHGGPFANIAHGTNSVVATRLACSLSDMVVTEAGFGADLGCEKFLDIVSPELGRTPDCVVVVATLKSLKYHGGCDKTTWNNPSRDAILRGFGNLSSHLTNIKEAAGLQCVVAINAYAQDDVSELNLVQKLCADIGVSACIVRAWEQGSKGAFDVADEVLHITKAQESFKLCKGPCLYNLDDSIQDKIEKVARVWYHARDVVYAPAARKKLADLLETDVRSLKVCIAKTQYSLSDDPHLLGDPRDYSFHVRDIRISAGAGFVVVLAGSVMTMPGLGKHPAYEQIDVDENGEIQGIF